MTWDVEFQDEFEPEFEELTEPVQDEIYALGKLLELKTDIFGD